jgi:hypothetical protein
MKNKKILWSIISIIFLTSVIFIMYTLFFAYEEKEKLYGFPIPNGAVLKEEMLLKSGKLVQNYHWSRASEENGVPFYYEYVIERKGWEFQYREGASSYYEKDGHVIDLLSLNDLLTITVIK